MNQFTRSAIAIASTVLALCVAPLAMAQSVGALALPARTSDSGGVRVVVTPNKVAAGSDWEFTVVMDTHTTPLNDDMARASVLIGNGERRYVPSAWQGDPPGGHHRKGILRFSAPAETLSKIELQIQGLGGPNKREFQWDIK